MLEITLLYKSIIFLVLFNFVVNKTSSQNIQENENPLASQIWLEFDPYVFISEKVLIYAELDYRTTFDNDDSWNRIATRPSVQYTLNRNIDFEGGVGLYYLFHRNKSDRFEISPWQSVSLKWPKWEKLKFKHQLKIEERLSFRTSEDWDSSFGLRVRFKTGGLVKVYSRGNSYWHIPFFAEFFYPLDDNIQEIFKDTRRLGIGIGYKSDKDWSLSFQYIIQTLDIDDVNDYSVSDNIFQIKFSKLWMKNKKGIFNKKVSDF